MHKWKFSTPELENVLMESTVDAEQTYSKSWLAGDNYSTKIFLGQGKGCNF